VTYCYYRSLDRRRWAIACGLAYGLALATKHNAWILPGVLAIHWLWVVVGKRRGVGRTVSRVPWWLIAMVVLGPPILVGTWPRLWYDCLARFSWYASFHLRHVHYPIAYFGEVLYEPPFPMEFPWVMTFVTIPLIASLLTVIGLFVRGRYLVPGWLTRPFGGSPRDLDNRHTDVLWFGAMMAPFVVIASPGTPVFGGTKHWMTGYPFMVLFAGVGFLAVVRLARRALSPAGGLRAQLVGVGLGSLMLVTPVLDTMHAHGFGLSYYSFAAGGVPGGADLGMNRQFWGFTQGALTRWFEDTLPEGGRVFMCDATPESWSMMHVDGALRSDVTGTYDLAGSDVAIVHHEHHFAEVDYQIWAAYQTATPAHVLALDGVPIISAYVNPGRALQRARPARPHAGGRSLRPHVPAADPPAPPSSR
jgi:hypothetical protein